MTHIGYTVALFLTQEEEDKLQHSPKRLLRGVVSDHDPYLAILRSASVVQHPILLQTSKWGVATLNSTDNYMYLHTTRRNFRCVEICVEMSPLNYEN